jgi:hypothetical protein
MSRAAIPRMAYFKFWLQPARLLVGDVYGPEYFNAVTVTKGSAPTAGAVPFEAAKNGTLAVLTRAAQWLPPGGEEVRTTHHLIGAVEPLTSDSLDYGDTVLWPR